MYRGVFRFYLFASVTLVPWTSLSSQSSAIVVKRADGLAAWEQVYSVLVYPRCINCHTATNYPQQGDDRHRHFANVIRGREGKGVPALTCATCHQQTNANGAPHPDPGSYAKKFSGKYENRIIKGGIGHNLPQEAPRAFAKAIVEVDGY